MRHIAVFPHGVQGGLVMNGQDDCSPTEKVIAPGDGYAGDATPEQTWQILSENPDAVLIDVRTDAEWSYVGIPDLVAIGKKTKLVALQNFPAMDVNPEFAKQVEDTGIKKDAPVLFICRSGQRSRNAAMILAQRGFEHCYNVAEGFEGTLDGDRHRGVSGGWKFRGLPWVQQ